ncbi:MAG: glycosyltransferase [Anaerolineales bacterium]|nr:glycosyltransferase [Anaerolineales bacterium]
MEKNKSISIVIRTLNEERWLGETLKAMTKQDLRPSEVIVVDSGSSDKTIEIAKQNGAKVIKISRSEFSFGRALNIGFANSSGEILITLTAHAIPQGENWLSNLVHHFENPKVVAVASRILPHPESSLQSWIISLPFLFQKRSRKNIPSLVWNSSTAIRKNIWKIYPFNEKLPYCEDRLWMENVISNGYDIIYEPKSMVWHYHSQPYKDFLHRSILIPLTLIKIKLGVL